jgi:hypothetical protein
LIESDVLATPIEPAEQQSPLSRLPPSYPSPSEIVDSVSTPAHSPLPSPSTERSSATISKRPPTPPLTRRHSQMKKSKPPALRDPPNRVSPPLGSVVPSAAVPSAPFVKAAPPPPLRRHDRTYSAPQTDTSLSKPPLSQDLATLATSSLENASPGRFSSPSRTSSINSVKRVPQSPSLGASSMPPPPPPPRRLRASSKSSTGSGHPVLAQSDKGDEKDEELPPNPSSAQDILANLSRLQKEVDDLRGQYESRKASS